MDLDNKWDKRILDVECQLNNFYNKTFGDTPFRVLFDYHPSFKYGILYNLVTEGTWDETSELQNLAREKIALEQERWKSSYDSKHAKPVVYNVGDIVFVRM